MTADDPEYVLVGLLDATVSTATGGGATKGTAIERRTDKGGQPR